MSQIITNFDNFTFRSHYMGELMTPAKGKTNFQKYNEAKEKFEAKKDEYDACDNKITKKAIKLLEDYTKAEIAMDELEDIKDIPLYSEVCKSRLIQIYTEASTGRIKNIQSKFFEKGLHCEEDAITLYSLWKQELFRKNKVRKDNGFIQGEMDFEEDADTSVDAKSSWDIFTFDKNAIKKIDRNYEWQGQCYMWLFNKKKHKIVYALLDTPDFLIKSQLKKVEYELPESEWEEAKKEVMHLNIYKDLPIERKLRVFEISRDDDKIDQIKANVPKWRYFLNNIKTIDNDQSDDS